MNELIIMVLLTAGVGLWMAGGIYWKGLRRIVWPTVVAVLALVAGGVGWPKLLALWLTLALVNALPYGDRTPWAARCAVFASFAVPSWWIHLIWWMPIMTGAPLAALMLASRENGWITWKLWEGAAGYLQAVTIILAFLTL